MDTTKAWFWKLLNVTLVVIIILGGLSALSLRRYNNSLFPARTIYVSAEGKTTVSPDIAKFSFSVVSEGMDPEKLAEDNNSKINKAIDYLKTQNIESKDIKTAGYDLSPRYEYDETKRRSFISGYTLTQTIFVKIRDFAKIGKILGGLPNLGINQISGLTFEVEDQDRYLNDARQEAFEKAYAKAKAMAKQNKVRIKRVVTFSENQGGYPISRFAGAEYGKGGDVMTSAIAPTIEPGTQEVTVNVTVTYEIR